MLNYNTIEMYQKKQEKDHTCLWGPETVGIITPVSTVEFCKIKLFFRQWYAVKTKWLLIKTPPQCRQAPGCRIFNRTWNGK